jgi:hypothetical protein
MEAIEILNASGDFIKADKHGPSSRHREIPRGRRRCSWPDYPTKAVLSACFTLIVALLSEIESGREVKTKEMKVIAQQALVPLINGIDMHWSEQSLTRAGVADQKPFRTTLALINLRKLGTHKDQIGRIALGPWHESGSRKVIFSRLPTF